MVYHIQMDKNQARVQPYQRGMDLAHSLIQSRHKIAAAGKCELQQSSPCKNVPKWWRNKFTKEGKAK
ncbi:unnamed protein product [Sphagnum jensenii]